MLWNFFCLSSKIACFVQDFVTREMAEAKVEGSRKDSGTPWRLTTASFFSPCLVETELGDDQEEEEVRGVDQDEEDGVCGVEAMALKMAFNWSWHSQDSARLT